MTTTAAKKKPTGKATAKKKPVVRRRPTAKPKAKPSAKAFDSIANNIKAPAGKVKDYNTTQRRQKSNGTIKTLINGLSVREERFCQAFHTMDSPSARGAAMEAGFHSEEGYKLLKRARIRQRIVDLTKQAARRSLMKKDDIMVYLCEIITVPITEIVDSALDDDVPTSPLLQKMTVTKGRSVFEMPSKLEALKELNRMMGNYQPDKVEVGIEGELRAMMLRLTGQSTQAPVPTFENNATPVGDEPGDDEPGDEPFEL